jgi:hypothetical protein
MVYSIVRKAGKKNSVDFTLFVDAIVDLIF